MKERIDDLKREISYLKWDLPNIRNDKLRNIKSNRLEELEAELSMLKINVNTLRR